LANSLLMVFKRLTHEQAWIDILTFMVLCVSLYIYVDATILYWNERIMSSAVCWLLYYFHFIFGF